MGQCDNPDTLDLDEREGAARNKNTDLVAEVEDDVGVAVDPLVITPRLQVDDLRSAGHSE